jgi:hypothetical protein
MNILVALQQLGYEVQVDGEALWLRWRRAEEPPWEHAVPLLKEAQRRKTEILATLVRSQVPATGGDASVRPRPQRSHRTAGARRQGSRVPTPPVLEHPTSETALIDTQANTINTPASPDDEDADKLISVLASTVQDPMRPVDRTCCGWCGSVQLWVADTGSGRIYCEACHAVYHPSQAAWSPGDSAKRRRD